MDKIMARTMAAVWIPAVRNRIYTKYSMGNTNLELLSHIKDYQTSGELSEEAWIFFNDFVKRLGYSGGKGYALTYPNLWQDMRDNAFDYIIKTSINNCDTDDPNEAWSYIRECVYGIFANTKRDHEVKMMWQAKYSTLIEEGYDDVEVKDDKNRIKAEGMDAVKDARFMKDCANYLIKYPHKKMIITDDVRRMRQFIGKQVKVDDDKKIKVESVKGKVMITLPNKDVGYAGDWIFKSTYNSKRSDSYCMIVPEVMANCYNVHEEINRGD